MNHLKSDFFMSIYDEIRSFERENEDGILKGLLQYKQLKKSYFAEDLARRVEDKIAMMEQSYVSPAARLKMEEGAYERFLAKPENEKVMYIPQFLFTDAHPGVPDVEIDNLVKKFHIKLFEKLVRKGVTCARKRDEVLARKKALIEQARWEAHEAAETQRRLRDIMITE